jgi:hypothetical protein
MSDAGCGMLLNLAFMRNRDGAGAALRFALQAVTTYRRAVRQRRGLLLRREMIEAYKVARRYLEANT